jgi:hypothetical protein
VGIVEVKKTGVPIEELQRSLDDMMRRFGRLRCGAEIKSKASQFRGPPLRSIPCNSPFFGPSFAGEFHLT